MDVHRTDAPAETHEPLGRVIIVLAIAFLGVAAIAASVDQAYCTDPEARFGGLGWLIVMAPVVFLGALLAADWMSPGASCQLDGSAHDLDTGHRSHCRQLRPAARQRERQRRQQQRKPRSSRKTMGVPHGTCLPR